MVNGAAVALLATLLLLYVTYVSLVKRPAPLRPARPQRRRSIAPPPAPATRPVSRSTPLPVREERRAPDVRESFPEVEDLLQLRLAPADAAPPKDPADRELDFELEEFVRRASVRMGTKTGIIRELSKGNWEPKRVADLIQQDPMIAGAVLRTVNSGFYGLRQRVASVLQAVLLLGHVEIRNLVWRASISDALDLEANPTRVGVDKLWRHSFTVSRKAHMLASATGHPRPDEVSTAALLHDIAKMIFLSVDPVKAQKLYVPLRFSVPRAFRQEQKIFGVSHLECGRRVCEAWGLPGKTIAIVAHHHHPSYVEPDQFEGDLKGLAIVHTADVLTHVAEPGRLDLDSCEIYRPRAGWLELVGIPDHRGSFRPQVVEKPRRPRVA